MPGFTGGYSERFKVHEIADNKLVCRYLTKNKLSINQHTTKKFSHDKVFLEIGDFFYLFDGVLLNSKELLNEYECRTIEELLPAIHEKLGDTFFSVFRGSFSGVVFNSCDSKLIVFTDHIGSKQVFYNLCENELVFSSSINELLAVLKEQNREYSFSEQSAYSLLSFGFLIEDNTMFKEIKKLLPGHYLIFENGDLAVKQFFLLDNTANREITEDDAIDKLDELFRQAVKRGFDKDLEYGYKHLVALSGGLDSRMTTWVAHDMGYSKQIVNFTFSQSNYLDETIPKQIAADLQHEWIFKALDNGLFLKNVEDVVRLSFGGVLYYGLAHGKSMLDLLNLEDFGIVHSGQLGDVVVGTFYSSLDENRTYRNTDGAYSTVLSNKLNDSYFKYSYSNEEIFKFYSRGFTGANQGLLPIQERTETYSPFYDVDFMAYCLSLPVEMRFGHRLYFKWLLKKYPEADKYIWEKTRTRVSAKTFTYNGTLVPYTKIFSLVVGKLIRKFGFKANKGMGSENHMNPLELWYNENQSLQSFMDHYYNDNIHLLDGYPELQKDCKYLWDNFSAVEKNQVITVLAIMRLYFV